MITLTTDIDINRNIHPDANAEDLATFSKGYSYDEETLDGSVWVSGSRIDDEGNEIGGVSVSGGVEVNIDDNNNVSASYWAYASSYVSDGNIGRGNAWVKVPGKPKSYHAYGPGDFWVDSLYSAEAWDDNTMANPGGRVMSAGAALSIQGARIRVEFEVSGI